MGRLEMERNAGVKYYSDPAWMKDAVSKFLESPVYSVPLLDFIDENCGMFQDSEDNKLEYTIVHENFKVLVDGLISDFLTSLGIPVPTFVHMLANEEHASLYSIVVASILTVDDFLLFKEMMLKRNFQISNQALSQIKNPHEGYDEPADLHSVIDNLSDVSKPQHRSDKEMAKSLSLADAFQQLAKVENIDSAAKCDSVVSLSWALDEETAQPSENHAGSADQLQEHHEKGKEKKQCPQIHIEGPEEFVEAPAPPDHSFQQKSPAREPSTSPVTESTVTFESKSSKAPNKLHNRGSKASVMEHREENPRTAKVTFEAPQEVVFNGEPEPEIIFDEEEGDDCEGATCEEDSADSTVPNEEEQAPEPTTFKMLEDLLDDVKMWKPKSLHLNVNDGEIQQRRRYLEQQRDRILAHKKSAREKQIRYFRQLEAKADATPQKLRRLTQPVADTEANKKRETLRKELARCLKEELSNKTSNIKEAKEIGGGLAGPTFCLTSVPSRGPPAPLNGSVEIRTRTDGRPKTTASPANHVYDLTTGSLSSTLLCL